MNKDAGVLKILSSAEDAVFLAEKVISIALLSAMTLVTTIQAILRYCFSMSILVGIDELINWTFVWLVFIGIAMLVRQGGHIGIEFFLNKMPIRFRNVGTIFISLTLIAMAGLIIINSIPFIESQMSIYTTSANIPKAFLYLSIPVGMGLLIFHLVVKIVKICSVGVKNSII